MTYEEYSKMRDRWKLTDYAVSKYTKVSRATFSMWKNGKITPSDNTIKRLKNFFDTYDSMSKLDSVDNPVLYNVQDKPQVQLLGFPPEFEDHKIEPVHDFCIDSFNVSIKSPRPVILSAEEYRELKVSTESFAQFWLTSHGKI